MPTITEKIESNFQRQYRVDQVRAAALDMNVHEYRAQHAAAVKMWTHTIKNLMEGAGVRDPLEVLPEIVVAIMQHAERAARQDARAAARAEIQRLLKKAAAP
jgi:hypothetical protein